MIRAVQAATSLVVAHLAGVGFIMYMDLSGRWDPYALCKNRTTKTINNYIPGLQSLVADIVCLFLPCLTICLWYQADKIVFDTTTTTSTATAGITNTTTVERSDDFNHYNNNNNKYEDDDLDQQQFWLMSLLYAVAKFVAGYVLGKVWAFGVHYILHHPRLYKFHKRHHQRPAELVASASWEDSWVEYAVMELPSFCITLFVFPNYWVIHLMHFALHGLDGAAGHSGFKAPGIMGTCVKKKNKWRLCFFSSLFEVGCPHFSTGLFSFSFFFSWYRLICQISRNTQPIASNQIYSHSSLATPFYTTFFSHRILVRWRIPLLSPCTFDSELRRIGIPRQDHENTP